MRKLIGKAIEHIPPSSTKLSDEVSIGIYEDHGGITTMRLDSYGVLRIVYIPREKDGEKNLKSIPLGKMTPDLIKRFQAVFEEMTHIYQYNDWIEIMQTFRPGDILQFKYRSRSGHLNLRTCRFDGLDFGSNEQFPEPQWFIRTMDQDSHRVRSFALNKIDTSTIRKL